MKSKILIFVLVMMSCMVFAQEKGDEPAGGYPPIDLDLSRADCGNPFSIAALPFAGGGDTTGATNTIASISAGCSDYSTNNGLDDVYEITLAAGNNVTFTLTPTTPGYDPSIYLVSTCGDGTTCVAGSDSGFSDDPESFNVSGLPAGTYYFFADAFFSESGAYDLDVTGTLGGGAAGADVPTLSEYALIGFVALFAIAGLFLLRRKS